MKILASQRIQILAAEEFNDIDKKIQKVLGSPSSMRASKTEWRKAGVYQASLEEVDNTPRFILYLKNHQGKMVLGMDTNMVNVGNKGLVAYIASEAKRIRAATKKGKWPPAKETIREARIEILDKLASMR